jgi:hyperosmotically inducible protein
MRVCKDIIGIAVAGLMAFGLSACEKEGPAEKAGKALDEAASNVADETENAMDSIEKKLEE